MRIRSESIYSHACSVIPGGVNSPVRAFKGLRISPLIAESGSGANIYDADGKEYIDYCMSWGALLLGHAHPDIVAAAYAQIRKGSSFGVTTEMEVKLAQKLAALIPAVEASRWLSSGTESAMTAIRVARGYTGRSKILKFSGHYHGHADCLLVQAGSGAMSLNQITTSKGVPSTVIADTLCFSFNDFHSIRSFFHTDPRAHELAAVILEPVAGNMGVVLPEPGFLEMLREETARVGALLIFDEVITGFRVGLQGAQGRFAIEPDLSCFGKIIGGGFPIAAIGGKKDILDHLAPMGPVYQAGTLSGNPVAVAVGLAILTHVERKGFFEELERKTNRLVYPVRDAIRQKGLNACIHRCGSMFSLFFGVEKVTNKEDLAKLDTACFGNLFRHLFHNGIYISPSPHEACFLSTAHTDNQIDATANRVIEFISNL